MTAAFMISTESFTREWIEQRSDELEYNDKKLLEKVIRAFSLLEMLVEAGAPLVFKGGSSLLLLLKDSLNRLSIDVDIICPPGEDIRPYLKGLEAHGFSSIVPVLTEHGGKDLPASHFKSFYEVAFEASGEEESFIRLDVLYENDPYAHTIELPIDSPFLKQDGAPLMVRLPSREDILGDKLTAFGPNTLGIPYYKEDRAGNQRRCSLEIIKQLFDINRLFEVVEDFTDTYQSFQKVAAVELEYRNMAGKLDLYFEDVRQSALCLSTRGQIGDGRYDEFLDGLSRIKSYMYRQNYYIENAIVDASRVAYLATCFQNGITDIQKYSPEIDLKSMEIFAEMPKQLQRLRKSSPEAFYYWARTYQLLSDNKVAEGQES